MADVPVRFISHQYEHASDHSGYDQISDRIGIEVELIDIERRRSRIIPARVANLLWPRSGNRLYGYYQFYMEVSAAVDMLRSRRCVYHFLWGESMYRYLGLMPRIRGHRIVATMHLPPRRFLELVSDPSYIRRLNGVIVVGTNQIPIFEPLVGRDRVFWIPLGVDTDVFVPAQEKMIQSPPLCLFVGHHLRDFETLCRTIEIINEVDPDIRFIVVTFESEFPRFNGLASVTLRSGIPEADLVHLYQQADLLLQPLHDTTANTAILEAIACGLPVIASDVGGVRDYIDETCSVLVPPRDAEAMAKAARELLGDADRRMELSEGAYQKAQEYRWEKVIDDLMRVYTEVLTR